MAKDKENNKGKKEKKVIKVDKDFLMEILKSLTEVREEINKLKQGSLDTTNVPPIPTGVSSQPDYIFRCAKTISVNSVPTTLKEMVHYKQLDKEFEAELQPLMRKFKVVQLTAMFLKKL